MNNSPFKRTSEIKKKKDTTFDTKANLREQSIIKPHQKTTHHNPNKPTTAKWVSNRNPKPSNQGYKKINKSNKNISFWESYVLFKRRKFPKKFPFLTPKQSLAKNMTSTKRPAKLQEKDKLRIIAFGWLEQVWINCMWFEYNNEVLIVDMWLQFPDQYSHWINFRVPDLTYLKNKKVVWIVITHGHIDHIWAIAHLLRYFDKQTPIYATPMAFELIKMKQEEYNLKAVLREYSKDKEVHIWKHFAVTPFVVDHSIPDSVWLFINTPEWNIVHTWDWKFDNQPPAFRPSVNYKKLESFWNIWVRMLLSDSTNAYEKGHSMSEKEVEQPLNDIFKWVKWRIITATFSSIIDRIALIIKTSEQCWRKVVLLWKWMNDYMTIAKKLWYVRHKQNTIIWIEEANKLPDNQVTICCTGAQGERYAALMRISIWESRDTKLKSTDTVVFSSSVIPWNERSVQELYWIIMESWAKTYTYRENNIHAWGHAREEDIKHMIDLIKPEFFMPIYGERHMLHKNAIIAESVWYKKENVIIARNWEILTLTDKWVTRSGFISHKYISVDWWLVGFTGEKELHERMQLKDSWTIFITITWQKNKFFYAISTVWFPDLDDKLTYLKNKIFGVLDKNIMSNKNKIFENIWDYRESLAKRVWNLIFHETEKEPIVMIHIVK